MLNHYDWKNSLKNRYFSESDFIKSSDFEKFAQNVVEDIPDDLRNEFENLQLIIFKPETVAAGKVQDAVSTLEKNGLKLTHAELIFRASSR